MGNKVNKQIGTYDKLQVKHSVHIVSSNIKQQSSFQFKFISAIMLHCANKWLYLQVVCIKIYINSPIYTLDLPQTSYKE
jgi:hypothetical protein